MAFRAFVAVPVPPEPSLAALLDELGRLDADLRPVDPGHLHFTLSFLGQVEDERRADAEAAVAEAAQGVEGFDVALRSVGAFPNVRHPRVVWVGVGDPRPMVAVALRVREALARRGFTQDEKDFRAHLTLARVKSPRGAERVTSFLRAHGQDELASFPAREVVLYQSRLGPKGPTYDALARAPLEA